MSPDVFADTLDRYAASVAAAGLTADASAFRAVARDVRASPGAVPLDGLYADLTGHARDGFLDRVTRAAEAEADPDAILALGRVHAGAADVADALLQTALSPEAHAAVRRLDAEAETLRVAPVAAPGTQSRWAEIDAERGRLLAPLATPGLARPLAPEAPPVRATLSEEGSRLLWGAWLGATLSVVGRVLFWGLAAAFVWAVVQALLAP